MPKQLTYSTGEVMTMLSCSAVSVKAMIDDGRIEAIKLRRDYRIHRHSLEAFLGYSIPDEVEQEAGA